MENPLENKAIAFVGAGRFFLRVFDLLMQPYFRKKGIRIRCVVDVDPNAVGLALARRFDIPVLSRYEDIFSDGETDVLIELTQDPALANEIRSTKPERLQLIDHFEAMRLWDRLRILQARDAFIEAVSRDGCLVTSGIHQAFQRFSNEVDAIVSERCAYSHDIESELIAHQQKISQIIAGSTIPTFVIDQDHVVTHWNKAMERLTGYGEAEMVGTKRQWEPFWEHPRPSMADVILDQIDRDEVERLYGGKWRPSALIDGAYEAEVFFPKLGSGGKWCFFTAAPIRAADGRYIGAIETLWDTTEQKKAEEEREAHTRELSVLCTVYSELSAAEPIQNRVQRSIELVREFLGVHCIGLFLDDPLQGFIPKYLALSDDNPCAKPLLEDWKKVLQKAVETSTVRTLSVVNDLALENTPSPEQTSLKTIRFIPISTKAHKTMGAMVIGETNQRLWTAREQNILELIGNRIGVAIENVELQEQLLESEEKYRSLFNNDPHPIFLLDAVEYRIRDINHRVTEVYGYTLDEIVGKPFADLGDETERDVMERIEELEANRSLLLSKNRHFRKDGRPFFVNINVRRAGDLHEDILIVTTTDITEVVEKETQLIQAGKMATLGLMAAGIAHEINQPLNVIQVCADFLLKMVGKKAILPEEEMASIANDIGRNVQRAADIIRHMRDFSRQAEAVKTKISINDPIRDVLKVLGHQIKAHEVELFVSLDDDLPQILASHNRLEQVFINLVTNAVDAMDEKRARPDCGKYHKRLEVITRMEKGMVCARITDNGIGMPTEVQKRIFEPFFTTKSVGKGTGLGVSISYGIVKDYDGILEVDSEPGQGTSFVVRFPPAEKRHAPHSPDR
uniref:histidine kinase n=1 Tax=Desulfatirhabdium butyrativorans TaxID=340467 RepID=A0A7C4W148_9BACT